VKTVDAIVLHSGGMDSSICLALAKEQFGEKRVLSLGFNYSQRHSEELEAANKIADHFGVSRRVIDLPTLPGWEVSSLLDPSILIEGDFPNSFVLGRNGLFLMTAAPLVKVTQAKMLFIGVMELEGENSGYPDCSREYIDCVEKVMRCDLQDNTFSIQTPLVHMTKAETMELAKSLGVLDFLIETTITCYHGISHPGCQACPACILRNRGLEQYMNL